MALPAGLVFNVLVVADAAATAAADVAQGGAYIGLVFCAVGTAAVLLAIADAAAAAVVRNVGGSETLLRKAHVLGSTPCE